MGAPFTLEDWDAAMAKLTALGRARIEKGEGLCGGRVYADGTVSVVAHWDDVASSDLFPAVVESGSAAVARARATIERLKRVRKTVGNDREGGGTVEWFKVVGEGPGVVGQRGPEVVATNTAAVRKPKNRADREGDC